MTRVRCAAIDVGATSGRVMLGELEGPRLSLREAHRFSTPLIRDNQSGYLTWEVERIVSEAGAGLRAADLVAPVESLGVDTWGVDYVLLDRFDQRIGPAISYRDGRTGPELERIFARMPADEIYRRTGVQLQSYNTLYQLAATARHHPDWLERARQVLLLPSYLLFRLGGVKANESTDASTTQLIALGTQDWDDELLALAGVSRAQLEPLVPPGTVLGRVAAPSGGRRRVSIVSPATHDTASAVAAIPLDGPDEAYISSGTWSLMGVETPVPLAGATARLLNFANERGVGSTYRVLKNIVGLWLVERIRQEHDRWDIRQLLSAAGKAEPWRSLIDPEDPRFLNPPSMTRAIQAFCAETGQPVPDGPAALVRGAIDSLAMSYRRVKEQLEMLRGRPLARIHIVGGGSRSRLLNQLCADACGLPVNAGPIETSALGNVCVQLIALGAIESVSEARAIVRRSFPAEEYQPRGSVADEVWSRYCSLTSRREDLMGRSVPLEERS